MKAAREAMNQMIEAWKEIPDLPDEISPPPESQTSSKGMRYHILFLFLCNCCMFNVVILLLVG